MTILIERGVLNMAFCGTKKFRCDSDMSLFLHDMAIKLGKSESEVIRIILFNSMVNTYKGEIPHENK